MLTPLRVALADDALLFREGLARILADAGLAVVGQVGDAEALVDLVLREQADVAVIDLRMPPTHTSEGIDAAVRIRGAAPEVGLLVLSQHVDTHHAVRLMEEFDAGVGYLLKDRVSDLAAFASDVARVAHGDVVIDPELVRRLVARPRRPGPLDTLTDRERRVLTLMARGYSNLALAGELHLSVKTVETHVRAVFGKLGLELDEREHRRVLAVLAHLRA